MNKILTLIIATSLFSITAISKPLDEKVLAKVGTENITYQNLEAAYQKNMSGEKKNLYDMKKDSLYQFLNLFIDYRLKVKDAIDRGFDKDKEVVDEINENKKLLTESYYYDKKVFQPMVNKLLNRRQYYIKFAYILFPYTKEAEGVTQSDPKKTAQIVLDSINNNQLSFFDAAKNHSKDPSTASNGGLVDRYMVSGTIQRPIEEVLFTLSEGQMSTTLLETSYGYFILKLVEKKPRKQVLAGHILISNKTQEITNVESKKADSLVKLIRKGSSFEKLAELNSDDPASAINGGSLGDYYDLATGFVKSKSFLDAHFVNTFTNLKDGQVSDTIHTAYGIHIIKRLDSKVPDKEVDEKDVKDYYKKASFDIEKEEYFEKYISNNGFEINADNFTKLVKSLNTSKTNLDSTWDNDISKDLSKENLFNYKNKSWTIKEFVNVLDDKSKTQFRATPLNRDGLKGAMNKIIKPIVIDEWTVSLENEYPEFKNLIQEFHDGILLFKVEALEVWDKLQLDTAMAREYFKTNGKKYYTNEKYDISEIFVLQDSLAKDVYARAKAGENFDELAFKFTVRQGYREKNGYHGELDAFDNKFSTQLKGEEIVEGKIFSPKNYQSGLTIIKINKIIKPKEKTFEESIPDIAPAVQQIKQKQLVKDWLKDVRKRHKVEINEETINEIYANHSK